MRANDPTITDSCSPFDGGIGVGGDPDRRPRLLERFGIDRYVCNLEFLAVKCHVIFSPETLDDFHTLNESAKTLCLVQVESLELLIAITKAKGGEGLTVVDNIEACQLRCNRAGLSSLHQGFYGFGGLHLQIADDSENSSIQGKKPRTGEFFPLYQMVGPPGLEPGTNRL
jgi:hypothetical protein